MIDNRIIVLGHLSHINYGQTGNVYSIGGVAPTITENHGKSINILVEASDE